MIFSVILRKGIVWMLLMDVHLAFIVSWKNVGQLNLINALTSLELWKCWKAVIQKLTSDHFISRNDTTVMYYINFVIVNFLFFLSFFSLLQFGTFIFKTNLFFIAVSFLHSTEFAGQKQFIINFTLVIKFVIVKTTGYHFPTSTHVCNQ